MIVRQLTFDDVSAVLRLEEESYLPELLETKRGFLRKIEIFPQGCLCCEEDGQIHAFIISHPWRGPGEVEVDEHQLAIPDSPDCYYIHDVVVENGYRGRGLAALLVKQIFQVAKSNCISRLVLVAVQDSEPFWAKYGFEPVRKLFYGKNVPATYMSRVVQ